MQFAEYEGRAIDMHSEEKTRQVKIPGHFSLIQILPLFSRRSCRKGHTLNFKFFGSYNLFKAINQNWQSFFLSQGPKDYHARLRSFDSYTLFMGFNQI